MLSELFYITQMSSFIKKNKFIPFLQKRCKYARTVNQERDEHRRVILYLHNTFESLLENRRRNGILLLAGPTMIQRDYFLLHFVDAGCARVTSGRDHGRHG